MSIHSRQHDRVDLHLWGLFASMGSPNSVRARSVSMAFLPRSTRQESFRPRRVVLAYNKDVIEAAARKGAYEEYEENKLTKGYDPRLPDALESRDVPTQVWGAEEDSRSRGRSLDGGRASDGKLEARERGVEKGGRTETDSPVQTVPQPPQSALSTPTGGVRTGPGTGNDGRDDAQNQSTGAVDSGQGKFTASEKRAFAVRRIISRLRPNRKHGSKSPGSYVRRSGGNGKSLRVLGHPTVAVYTPDIALKNKQSGSEQQPTEQEQTKMPPGDRLTQSEDKSALF